MPDADINNMNDGLQTIPYRQLQINIFIFFINIFFSISSAFNPLLIANLSLFRELHDASEKRNDPG